MLTTTLMLGMLVGGLLASFLGLFRRPAGAPGQIITVNPVPAAKRPPGCLARLGNLVRLGAIGFLALFFLRLILLS
jgi:hypothetical protein